MELAQLFNSNPMLFTAFIALLGLLVGSFLNVVILRLPMMMEADWKAQCKEFLNCSCTEANTTQSSHSTSKQFNLVFPASHCPKCHSPLRAWHNIPVISFLLLKGRCHHCGDKISWRYPVVESLTALFSALLAWHFGFGWQCAAALILVWVLIALSVIDFDHQLLPDDLTLPLLWLGLLLNYVGLFTDLHSAVLGAAFGYGSLWSVYWLFKLVTGKEGMGYGDFKLLAVLGAWFGWQLIPLIIILSSLVGALVGITLIISLGRDKNIPIPFGPYLAAAGFIALLWGEPLTRFYLHSMAP